MKTKWPKEAQIVSAILFIGREILEIVEVESTTYLYLDNGRNCAGRLVAVRHIDREDPYCDRTKINIDQKSVRPLTPAARAMLAIAKAGK